MNPQKQYEALNVIPFIKEFDEEMLTIKGLDALKYYNLKIDGKTIRSFTGERFKNRIKLALLSNTPHYQQARQIMELQLKRKDLEDKLRAFYFISYDYLCDKGWFLKDSPAITDSLMAEAKKNPFINGKKNEYLKHIRNYKEIKYNSR